LGLPLIPNIAAAVWPADIPKGASEYYPQARALAEINGWIAADFCKLIASPRAPQRRRNRTILQRKATAILRSQLCVNGG
jgi:hypothetical protein